MREKMVEAPALLGAAGANVSPRANGSRVNGVEPRDEDVPSQAALTPETSKGPGFSSSQKAALEYVTSIPESFDIVDPGAWELALLGCPRAPLLPAS
jgi:hypothetical protein